ncbi:MAG: hypothetical protein K0R24_335 [Gammaproteobacteria bacterium]|jgi:conjugative transfer pilus assembly protein TraH|nr:hypothetical protein [Gammaproteobacteria bacterium]
MKLGGSFFSIVLFVFASTLYADSSESGKSISDDLNAYFNRLGFSSSITSPQAYNGQRAGFYTGGSLFMRAPVNNLQLMEVDLPSYHAGCGGIDLYAGGISFIKAPALINAMKGVMNNAGGYAFMLALETATPELANVLKNMYGLANSVNHLDINSCEIGQDLVGGLWPRTQASQQQICRDVGSNSERGLFSDWAEARQKCGTEGSFNDTMNKARQDPHYKNLVFDRGNIVWKALKQNSLLNKDDELAEFFMTLSGTVILYKETMDENATIKHVTLPSKMDDNNNLIKVLLKGGTATIYHCRDSKEPDGCLDIDPQGIQVQIGSNKSFGARVKTLLDSMADKIVTDTALTDEEKGLLQATSLPIYKMLNVKVAFTKGNQFVDVSSYSDAIANDILYQYLKQSLETVRLSLSAVQYPDDLINELRPRIDKEIDVLREEQQSAYTRMSTAIQIIQETQLIERMLAGDLSTELGNTLSWAKALK